MALDPRLIAFHLPQFHSIPENDRWWGKGFTEWTNVKRAQPLFEGHYQPHRPSKEVGHYDMLKPETREMQARLAREAGLSGFCYYHYWFKGKLLLEKPLHDLLEMGRPDFPFTLCWANEPWTRAWDGRSGVVLQEQKHSEDDDRAHLRYLKRFFLDPRYIRIQGKPLFIVYRAQKLPNAKITTEIWRDEAKRLGLGELYLCRVECYPNEFKRPTDEGFDAAVIFEPDWGNLGTPLREEKYGSTDVYRYPDVVGHMLTKGTPPYTHFPSVFPSWDNYARRKNTAVIVTDSDPAFYELWLALTLQSVSQKPSAEQVVFINAWNEWGEGNHLEPDERFGKAYLEATRAALASYRSPVFERFVRIAGAMRATSSRLGTELQSRIKELQTAYHDRAVREKEFKQAVAYFRKELSKKA